MFLVSFVSPNGRNGDDRYPLLEGVVADWMVERRSWDLETKSKVLD